MTACASHSLAVHLACALGLQPLWRVQLNDRAAIADSLLDMRAGLAGDLPFHFFQRCVGELLEIRSPGGMVCRVRPVDVCDLIPAEPVLVHAMPLNTYMARVALPLAERQAPAPPEAYQPAHVLWAQKDRWGHVEAGVWFAEEHLNTNGEPGLRPLRDDDHRRLQALARRSRMPVLHLSRANYSAAHGVAAREGKARREAASFLSQRVRGLRATGVLA